VPGPDASPCAAALVASWRPREWSPHMGTAVPGPSGEVPRRAEAAAGSSRAARWNRGRSSAGGPLTVERDAEQEQRGARRSRIRKGHRRRAEQSGVCLSSPPFLIQLVQWKRRTCIYTVIKYEWAHNRGLLDWYGDPRRGVWTKGRPIHSILLTGPSSNVT
jgi:hypothetical protein